MTLSGDMRRSSTAGIDFLPLAIERFRLLVRQRDYFRNPMQTFFRFSLVSALAPTCAGAYRLDVTESGACDGRRSVGSRALTLLDLA